MDVLECYIEMYYYYYYYYCYCYLIELQMGLYPWHWYYSNTQHTDTHITQNNTQHTKLHTPWPESASELYRPSYRPLVGEVSANVC
jgi:hypothetical protein